MAFSKKQPLPKKTAPPFAPAGGMGLGGDLPPTVPSAAPAKKKATKKPVRGRGGMKGGY